MRGLRGERLYNYNAHTWGKVLSDRWLNEIEAREWERDSERVSSYWLWSVTIVHIRTDVIKWNGTSSNQFRAYGVRCRATSMKRSSVWTRSRRRASKQAHSLICVIADVTQWIWDNMYYEHTRTLDNWMSLNGYNTDLFTVLGVSVRQPRGRGQRWTEPLTSLLSEV